MQSRQSGLTQETSAAKSGVVSAPGVASNAMANPSKQNEHGRLVKILLSLSGNRFWFRY